MRLQNMGLGWMLEGAAGRVGQVSQMSQMR